MGSLSPPTGTSGEDIVNCFSTAILAPAGIVMDRKKVALRGGPKLTMLSQSATEPYLSGQPGFFSATGKKKKQIRQRHGRWPQKGDD